jgi:hypothetical protein
LGDAATRSVRWVAIENFGEGAEAVCADVASERLEIAKGSGAVAINAEMRKRERP